MGLLFEASSEYVRRTASLPSTTAITMCGWFYLEAISGSWQYILDIDDASSNWQAIAFNTSGSLVLTNGGGDTAFGDPTFGEDEWVFFWWTCNGTGAGSMVGGYARVGDTAFTTASRAGQSFTPSGMYVANNGWSEWLNARAFNVKVWDAALSQAELLNEMNSIPPKRFANLHSWAPLWSTADINDYGGGGRNWTAGGTPVNTNNAPIGWGSPLQSPLVTGAAGGDLVLTGTTSITFGASGSATANGALAGTTTVTFGATGAAAANGVATGTTSITFGATGTATGTGALAGATSLTFAATGDLDVSANGDLTGTTSLTFGATGLVTADGVLAGATSLTFGEAAALAANGVAAGTTSLTFSASGAVNVPGVLAGTTTITLGASGAATGTGVLAGTTTLTFAATGQISSSAASIVEFVRRPW